MIVDDPSPGLRERKKRATRAQLSAIALRHAIERGVAHVRVEDIAAEADVSPRTFANYFSSKEAAIVDTAAIRTERFCAILRARPAGEPLHDALHAASLALFEAEPDRDWTARARLIRAEPSLFAEAAKSDIAIERSIAVEVGRRIGVDPSTDIMPRLAAAAVVAAIRTAVQFWLESSAAGSLHTALDEAMKRFRVGERTSIGGR